MFIARSRSAIAMVARAGAGGAVSIAAVDVAVSEVRSAVCAVPAAVALVDLSVSGVQRSVAVDPTANGRRSVLDNTASCCAHWTCVSPLNSAISAVTLALRCSDSRLSMRDHAAVDADA